MTNFTFKLHICWIICGYLTLVTTRVMSDEFCKCYDDVNICLWTNGTPMTYSEAQTACEERGSFLPRITNSSLQDKLYLFRHPYNDTDQRLPQLGGNGFYIDVKTVGVSSFHWIDGSTLAAEGDVRNQGDTWRRCVAIKYKKNKEFVFTARRWQHTASSYICQLRQGATCAADELSMNSKCYRKFHSSSRLTWFSASNDCLTHGGSLAVFTDTGKPSQNSNLTDWLSTNKSYWIGLVRWWWKTKDESGRAVDVQYSNWNTGHPQINNATKCVMVNQNNYWISWNCRDKQRFVCQSNTSRSTTATATIRTETTAPPPPPSSPTSTSSPTTTTATKATPSSAPASLSSSSPTKTTTAATTKPKTTTKTAPVPQTVSLNESTSTFTSSSTSEATNMSLENTPPSPSDYTSYVTTTTTWTTTATSMKSTRTTTPYMVNTPSQTSSTSSVSSSLSSSTTTTTKTPTERAVSLDIIIGVVVPCITICVIVFAVLVYCHKNKHRDSHSAADRSQSRNDHYVSPNDIEDQHPYDAIQLDQRYEHQHNAPHQSPGTAADNYMSINPQTQGQDPEYEAIKFHDYENAAAAAAQC